MKIDDYKKQKKAIENAKDFCEILKSGWNKSKTQFFKIRITEAPIVIMRASNCDNKIPTSMNEIFGEIIKENIDMLIEKTIERMDSDLQKIGKDAIVEAIELICEINVDNGVQK